MAIPALHGARGYAGGVERRRHTVLVTRNSEYHCRDGRCVAVRDLRTGQLSVQHHAVGMQLSGGIRTNRDGGVDRVSPPDDLRVGDQLCFSSRFREREYEVLTSALITIVRPGRDVVAFYQASA